MVGRRTLYDEAMKENDTDMVQSIKDASFVRSLPTIAWQAAIGVTNLLRPSVGVKPNTWKK
jgi:hypothetical protein